MGKRVKEVALGTRTARMKLAQRHKPYFRLLTDGVHVGYRRSTVAGRAGAWLARHYLSAGAYETESLGIADDMPDQPADGVRVLTFAQAESAARTWARGKVAAARADICKSETIRTVIETYIAGRSTRNERAGRNAMLRLNHHVLTKPIADVPLLELTDKALSAWRDGLKRGGRLGKTQAAPLAPATLARLLNDVRAALTEGARKAKSPADVLTIIRHGLKAPKAATRARAIQLLADADVRRVLAAAEAHDADFGALVTILAATGARFDQAARITVADFQPEARRVMVPVSNKGAGEKRITHIAVPVTGDVVARVLPLTAGRAGHQPLLMRWHRRQVPGDKERSTLPTWERIERRPWQDAVQIVRPWRAAVKAAGLPTDRVPYALRHSSIVRGLRAGLPISIVAKVHDTSVAMIERHYAAFILDATEELLRRAAVPLVSAEIVPIRATA